MDLSYLKGLEESDIKEQICSKYSCCYECRDKYHHEIGLVTQELVVFNKIGDMYEIENPFYSDDESEFSCPMIKVKQSKEQNNNKS